MSLEKAERFRQLHEQDQPFVLPNPWDAGSARILAGVGFPALATSSAGFAFTTGSRDHGIAREDALRHAEEVAAAVDVPVSADLENGFGDDPDDVAETIRLAAQTGIVGASIEDAGPGRTTPLYELELAAERVAAGVTAASAVDFPFVLTARAENFLFPQPDLDDTIARLLAYQAAGADVLYAPGLPDLRTIETVCSAAERPVNVLLVPALARHTARELADAGAARISLGGVLARHVLGHLYRAAREIQEDGTFGFTSVLGTFETLDRFLRPGPGRD